MATNYERLYRSSFSGCTKVSFQPVPNFLFSLYQRSISNCTKVPFQTVPTFHLKRAIVHVYLYIRHTCIWPYGLKGGASDIFVVMAIASVMTKAYLFVSPLQRSWPTLPRHTSHTEPQSVRTPFSGHLLLHPVAPASNAALPQFLGG